VAAEDVIPLSDVGLDDVALVGGKSAHLGDLLRAGFPVPPGFAVTTEAFGRDDVAAAVVGAYDELARAVGVQDPRVAVRSSAVAEDLPDASFAGVQDTYLWVSRGGLADAVRRCWASFDNPAAVAYRREHGIGSAGMGVAVQSMVDARVAGVMFTLNPLTGDPSSVAIDASYGLGTTVVGGEVTPDSFLWSKPTRTVTRRELGTKEVECVPDPAGGGTIVRPVSDELRAQPCLTDAEIARLAELARGVQEHYGRHLDLEWAIDRRLDEVFLLQARPETVWSRKREGAPPRASTGTLSAIAATFSAGRAPKT
jgi:pyruvate,water dikinase